MATVGQQIQSANKAICDNIARLSDDRALLSRNLLSQSRNLVEGVAVLIYAGDINAEFTYETTGPAIAYVGSGNKKINFLNRFHKLLQESVSHYTMDGDLSERLMIKYYEYFIRIRALLLDTYNIKALANLESFPIDLDPALRDYHQKIAERIDAFRLNPDQGNRNRYYIHRVHPFFVNGRIFYEVTFQIATDRANKFDRIIAFTDIDITDNYAAYLTLVHDDISVIGHTMPILLISEWKVSIRPCEFDNFARLFSVNTRVQSVHAEYQALMDYLTTTSSNLIDVIFLPDRHFQEVKNQLAQKAKTINITPVLERARTLVINAVPGANIIKYLMLKMNNVILKQQYSPISSSLLSNLNLQNGCKPFDTMPFCTSPIGHNPRISDLFNSLDAQSRVHELLARKIKTNVQDRGMLYTPVSELEQFGDLESLIENYNHKLWHGHKARRSIIKDKEHVFIREYEDDAVSIINELKSRSSTGLDGYTEGMERWITETSLNIDDPFKNQALKELYSQSHIALIYGAAGTGKTKMIEYVSNFFADKSLLFLAQTNPAVNNLQRRVNVPGAEYRTVASHIKSGTSTDYDVLVVDECSTVGNNDFLKVLQRTSFKLLLLVGDIYQIEAIEFGNWFRLVPDFIPSSSVFELTEPFRTKNENLLGFWSAVRKIDNNIAEIIAQNGYAVKLDESLFASQNADEIILCLNYDGLYGINNVNRFFQGNNPNAPVQWGIAVYKVGDPVLFNDSDRFRGVIYNNLKGKIAGVKKSQGVITFDIEIDRVITELDTYGTDLEWLGDSTVRFSVFEHESSDGDDEPSSTRVPFQIAYAVSIHKAQGLEYDSVKIVITDANEDSITHSIFYTAVTRARKELKILWSPEVQQSILSRLERPSSKKDVGILSSRRGLKPQRKGTIK